MKVILTIICLTLFATIVQAQPGSKKFRLDNVDGLTPVGVSLKPQTYVGRKAIQVLDTAGGITPGAKYVTIDRVPFHNGTIEGAAPAPRHAALLVLLFASMKRPPSLNVSTCARATAGPKTRCAVTIRCNTSLTPTTRGNA